MNTQNKKLISGMVLGIVALAITSTALPQAFAGDENEGQPETAAAQAPTPNGDTFTLRVVNKSKQDMVLFVDTNCARGPDYQQGVNAGQTRDLSYSTYSGGSCYFERSGVRIGIKDLTPTRMHWQSSLVPAGWGRGEVDGPLPDNMVFQSSQDGGATLTYAPK